MSSKSMEAMSWMDSYFARIGNKRPDKHGIYLPSCLTEASIYARMLEEQYPDDHKCAVCFSQFNRLYRKHYPHVTIPKVSVLYTVCLHCAYVATSCYGNTGYSLIIP